MNDIENIITKIHEYPGRWERSSHDYDAGAGCVMEIISWAAGLPWSDLPPCVPYEAAKLCQRIHDAAVPRQFAEIWTDDRLRAILRLPHGREHSQQRAYIAAEIGREYAMIPLRARGFDMAEIEWLPPITSRGSALDVRDALRKAAEATGVFASDRAADAAHRASEAGTEDADHAAIRAAYAADDAASVTGSTCQEVRLRILDAWCAAAAETKE